MANKKSVKDQVSEAMQSMDMVDEDIEDLHETLGIYDIPEIEDPYGDGVDPNPFSKKEQPVKATKKKAVKKTVVIEEDNEEDEYQEFLRYKEEMRKRKEAEKKAKVQEEPEEEFVMDNVIDEEEEMPVLKAPKIGIQKKSEEKGETGTEALAEPEEELDDESDEVEMEIIEPSKPEVKVEETAKKSPKYKEGRSEKLTKKQKIREEIVKMEFNVDEIEIVEEPNGLSKIDDYDTTFNAIPTYQVACNQSCYLAHMSSLKYGDSMAIKNSVASPYQERERIYRTLFEKMEKCSIPGLTYKDFLRITSFNDVETLMYGIYQQSFPGKTEFTIECRHCGHTETVQVPNDNLIATKDEEVYKDIEELIATTSKPEEALRKSVVNKTVRKVLPDSKIVVDIAIPSLQDHLDLLGSVNPKALETQNELITLMLFIKAMYIMDIKETRRSGKPKYYKLEGREQMAKTIQDLTMTDSKKLYGAIAEKNDRHAIDYAIKSFECPNSECRKQLGDMSIDMERLLFFNILQ